MKNIGILGSTGSIGTQTLQVIDELSDVFNVKYLTAQDNIQLLSKQALKFEPDIVCIVNEQKRTDLQELLKGSNIKVTSGRSALLELSYWDDIDLVMNGLVGGAGMEPTVNAVKAGVDVALSNKESLVMAGGIINELLKKHSGKLYPIDSEHSAIWQCLIGEKKEQVRKIILTGSGGPFRTKPMEEFSYITKDEALKHPNWSMGEKITIDSATMMNKGLEVIEAFWLFDVTADQIDIVIHPQSIIHSMVEYVDGSVKAQLGLPDMKIPIQFALTYPHHVSSNWESLNLASIGKLTFEPPNLEKFPCIRLAYDALKEGGTYPAVLNIANDEVVSSFLRDIIPFNDIPHLIESAMNNHQYVKSPTLEEIIEIGQWTSQYIHKQIHAFA